MTCPFSSKEEVYKYVCDFLKSNPSKEDISHEANYLADSSKKCTGDIKNALVEATSDLVNLYFDAVTLDSLIKKYCKAILNISTSPSGANVYVDGEYKGVT